MQAVYLLLVVVAAAAADTKFIPLLSRTETSDPSGAFTLSYKTGNGISQTELGRLIPSTDGKGEVLVKEGTLTYTAPDGTPIELAWVADANGFRPVGRHLPVPVVALPVPATSFL